MSLRRLCILIILIAMLGIGINIALARSAPETSATTVSTFESISIYWKPDGGSMDRAALVRFRKQGDSTWRDGYPLWFSTHDMPTSGKWMDYTQYDRQYRGSIVHLEPSTTYEIELTLEGTGTKETIFATTWSEEFPVAQTVYLPEFSSTRYTIDQSGDANGYILYTHEPDKSATIDVENGDDYNIYVDASYVIIRGLTLKGAGVDAIHFAPGVHDVIIEENDISGWGEVVDESNNWGSDRDAAIRSHGSEDRECVRIVVQRNIIHHPRADSNSWGEAGHPLGPQGIVFHNTGGNHVIRYNTIYSDDDHKYNDAIGAGTNDGFYGGFPGRDSDIHGNIVMHAWDDGIESEGDNTNVRIWGNYISHTFQGIATNNTEVGPLYAWRNVYDVSQYEPVPSDQDRRGNFNKAENYVSLFFHNTVLQRREPGLQYPLGAVRGISGIFYDSVTRNNIFETYDPENTNNNDYSAYSVKVTVNERTDMDYDLFNGEMRGIEPEPNGIPGAAIYDPAPGIDLSTGRGIFTLSSASPGFDAGQYIPNFSDGYLGNGPDVGAHEAGSPPMEFGVNAYRNGPPLPATPTPDGGATTTPTPSGTVPPPPTATATDAPTATPTATKTPKGKPPKPTKSPGEGGGNGGNKSKGKFGALHDTRVYADDPDDNFGENKSVRLLGGAEPINSYLKFVVSGVTGVVTRATLHLWVKEGSDAGSAIYQVQNTYRDSDEPWTEEGMTWNNAPLIEGQKLDELGSLTDGEWVTFDVTAAVTGDGTYSFGLTNPSADEEIKFNSKDAEANFPELEVEYEETTPTSVAPTPQPTTQTETATPLPPVNSQEDTLYLPVIVR